MSSILRPPVNSPARHFTMRDNQIEGGFTTEENAQFAKELSYAKFFSEFIGGVLGMKEVVGALVSDQSGNFGFGYQTTTTGEDKLSGFLRTTPMNSNETEEWVNSWVLV